MSFALSRFNPRVGEILSLRGLLSEGVQLHLLVTVFSKNVTYGGRRRENEIEAIFTLQVSNKFLICYPPSCNLSTNLNYVNIKMTPD